MKTKTLSLVALVVVLIGGICLTGYAQKYPPTSNWEEKDRQRIKDMKAGPYLANPLNRNQAFYLARSRFQKRLKLLEERVTRLEHALTTELSHVEVLPYWQDAFDAETTRRSNESKAEIQRAVHNRVLKAVVPLPE